MKYGILRIAAILAILAALSMPCGAATLPRTDFVPLLKRIPAPPGSVQAAARDVKNENSIQAGIRRLREDLAATDEALQRAANAARSSHSSQSGIPRDAASLQALQAKLASMTPQEKVTWAMQRQQEQARLAAARLSPGGHSPAVQRAYGVLMKIRDELAGPFNDDTGRRGPSFLERLQVRKFQPADAELARALKSIDARYPAPSPGDLGYSGTLYPERIAAYLYKHHSCHKYYDNLIRRAKERPATYSDWLGARRRAWQHAETGLEDIVTREQAALAKIDYGAAFAAGGVRYTEVSDLRVLTLHSIGGLLKDTQAFKENQHFSSMDAAAASNGAQPDHDQQVIDAITGTANRLATRLKACLAGSY